MKKQKTKKKTTHTHNSSLYFRSEPRERSIKSTLTSGSSSDSPLHQLRRRRRMMRTGPLCLLLDVILNSNSGQNQIPKPASGQPGSADRDGLQVSGSPAPGCLSALQRCLPQRQIIPTKHNIRPLLSK